MLTSPLLAGHGGGTWTLTLSANEANVNIKTKLEALYGSMSSAVVAVVTINSGVEIYSSTGSGYPAMQTGTSWPSGSTLKIVNYGKIRGAGGDGAGPGIPGWYGGDALSLGISVTIDNTSVGNIFGGGGGGGQGGQITSHSGEVGGGGGGGGQGDNGGGGGAHATAGITYPGEDGYAGAETHYGEGGNGGVNASGSYNGGKGGYGGGWGTAGTSGYSATVGGVPGGGGVTAGGAAGKAIDKNGKTVTWIAGNNATQVKGAVS